jgi:hypothetical protein
MERRARAMHGENLRKFTETRATAPRASHALILPRPKIQYRKFKKRRKFPARARRARGARIFYFF